MSQAKSVAIAFFHWWTGELRACFRLGSSAFSLPRATAWCLTFPTRSSLSVRRMDPANGKSGDFDGTWVSEPGGRPGPHSSRPARCTPTRRRRPSATFCSTKAEDRIAGRRRREFAGGRCFRYGKADTFFSRTSLLRRVHRAPSARAAARPWRNWCSCRKLWPIPPFHCSLPGRLHRTISSSRQRSIVRHMSSRSGHRSAERQQHGVFVALAGHWRGWR